MAAWLRVRLTGHAQTAYKRLDTDTRNSYEAVKEALKSRFEPESKRRLYAAEFAARSRKPGEDWASFGEDLEYLGDKAFPDLQEEAREKLSVDRFVNELHEPQVAFAVRQKQPKTISEAITAALQMHSFLPSPTARQPEHSEAIAAVRSTKDTMLEMMQKLASRMDILETDLTKRQSSPRVTSEPPARTYRGFEKSTPREPRPPVFCRRCGHYARGCAAPRQNRTPENF